MSRTKLSKRKYCSLSASEVDICVIKPETQFPFSGDGCNTDDIAKIIKSSMAESIFEDQQELRISDLISHLEKLQVEHGDLKLCFADAHSLFTLSLDNVNFCIASKRSYDFAFGLDEDQYLSVKFE